MIGSRARLIPRYNWDYGIADLLKGIAASVTGRYPLEEEFLSRFNSSPLFTSSGRASLYAILKGLGLPPGTGIGVPLFCCPVVFEAITEAGLTPVFLDINQDDYCLSAADFKRKRQYIGAVVVVHMFGHPVDMDAVASAADGLPIIEDCAHSLFSTYKGRLTGLIGDASFFSFRSGKYISVGEGSAIFTKSPQLYNRIQDVIGTFEDHNLIGELARSLAVYVKSTLYHRPWYGLMGLPIGRKIEKKLNLTAKSGFEAKRLARSDSRLIGERLKSFRTKIDQQRVNSFYLIEHLSSLSHISLPIEKSGCRGNYYQFCIGLESQAERDRIANRLFKKGVDAAKYLDDIAELAINDYGYLGDCPTAEACSKTCLILPNHYNLRRRDLARIVNSIRDA